VPFIFRKKTHPAGLCFSLQFEKKVWSCNQKKKRKEKEIRNMKVPRQKQLEVD
jgi:hypothetical protein